MIINKLILLIGLVVFMFANEYDKNIEAQIDSFKNSEIFDELTKNTKMGKREIINVAKTLNNETLLKETENIVSQFEDNQADMKKENEFTLFYFISKNVSLKALERFMYQYDKLKKIHPNIVGRVMLNGYPTYLGKKTSGSISTSEWLEAKTIVTDYGSLSIDEKGLWTYELNEKLEPRLFKQGEVRVDTIEYEYGKQNQKEKISVSIQRIDDKIGIIVKNSPVGMAEYIKEVANKIDIKPKDFKFHVHPWAFEEIGLKEVPAYMLSYCDDDFRFKKCEHRYLARGEMDLSSFFEIVGEEDKKYKRYYFDVIGAK